MFFDPQLQATWVCLQSSLPIFRYFPTDTKLPITDLLSNGYWHLEITHTQRILVFLNLTDVNRSLTYRYLYVYLYIFSIVNAMLLVQETFLSDKTKRQTGGCSQATSVRKKFCKRKAGVAERDLVLAAGGQGGRGWKERRWQQWWPQPLAGQAGRNISLWGNVSAKTKDGGGRNNVKPSRRIRDRVKGGVIYDFKQYRMIVLAKYCTVHEQHYKTECSPCSFPKFSREWVLRTYEDSTK